MAREQTGSPQRATLAVHSPGAGRAREFRVQYQFGPQTEWRLYASVMQHDRAQNCISELRARGLRARVVRYATCPTAN